MKAGPWLPLFHTACQHDDAPILQPHILLPGNVFIQLPIDRPESACRQRGNQEVLLHPSISIKFSESMHGLPALP